jgi:hypothetical protein
MLQEGCLIPSVGGGICQLSNALYQVALDAGCEIVERHAHSRVVPGSATAAGRDATVAWNYIDLRFRPKVSLQLRVLLTETTLMVSLLGSDVEEEPKALTEGMGSCEGVAPGIFADHACESCGNVRCFRHSVDHVALQGSRKTAYLLDVAWPEYIEYVASHRKQEDVLAIPIDGKQWSRPQYAWPVDGFAVKHAATFATLARAARSRRLAAQGAARQRSFLDGAGELARQLGKALGPEVDEVCVSQSLLPFLWRTGSLGGRRIRVLMGQLPMRELEQALDGAFAVHPESKTLRDFRAEAWLIDAEEEALFYAAEIVTPHAFVASLFPTQASLLEWTLPEPASRGLRSKRDEKLTVFFPCSTLGRKGAYEVREAMRGLDAKLLLGGKVLEQAGFWDGIEVSTAAGSDLTRVDLVIEPAVVESQPRALLRALAAGVPVISTVESGLHSGCGARFVKKLESGMLQCAIVEELAAVSRGTLRV